MRTIALPLLPPTLHALGSHLVSCIKNREKNVFVISFSYSIDLSITALSFINLVITIDFL